MPNILITGANRGIGLELARQYAAAGWDVIATARDTAAADDMRAIPGVTARTLDVSDHGMVDDLARRLNQTFDVVIANAGVMGTRDGGAQEFGTLDYGAWLDVMMINTFGAVKTLEAFTPHLERSSQKKMVAITSLMGSITDTSGGMTAYRVSKAALNMALVAAAASLKAKGIAVGVLHPGWVKTDMGGESAPVTRAQSAEGLRSQIDALTPADQAHFKAFDGRTLPW